MVNLMKYSSDYLRLIAGINFVGWPWFYSSIEMQAPMICVRPFGWAQRSRSNVWHLTQYNLASYSQHSCPIYWKRLLSSVQWKNLSFHQQCHISHNLEMRTHLSTGMHITKFRDIWRYSIPFDTVFCQTRFTQKSF